MSSVLDRAALEESPLADLHLLASELGVDDFRRLRREELVRAILAKQGVELDDTPEEGATDEGADDDDRPGRRRGRRGGRGRQRRDEDPAAAAPEAPREERTVEGTVELLANGSGFVRLTEGETSDDDVYISAAQVKRCELVSGDKVTGPVRPPRRSERYASLVRVDTINERPADEVSEGTRFEDLPVAFPSERLALGGDDPTVKAIEWLTPFGKGSRVVISGPARSGKTEALKRVGAALSAIEGIELTVVLAGVRPEEIAEWRSYGANVVSALPFSASADAQATAVEQCVEQARRVAARGGDAVVLVDTLEHLSPAAARRALAAARNIVDGGSLTIIATALAPVGGETTVVALDPALASIGSFPALALAASGTMRPEMLVGEDGAQAIAQARTEALGS